MLKGRWNEFVRKVIVDGVWRRAMLFCIVRKYAILVVAALLCIMYIGCTTKDRTDSATTPPQSRDSVATKPAASTFEDVELIEGQAAPPGAQREFPNTDFSITSLQYSDVISGGPPKDGIPAIHNPTFVSIADADEWVAPAEMVFVVDGTNFGVDEAHIYPVQLLIYHEIINDAFGDTPIAVTYCPLCNSALAFHAKNSEGQTLSFGVSGRLRYSNMIMYDLQHESWWQQATGEAVVGFNTGEKLRIIPLYTLSWEQAKQAFPDAMVVSQDTGYSRPYGRNPYIGYDTLDHPFLYRGPAIADDNSPFERVVVVEIDGEQYSYLYSAVTDTGVLNTTAGTLPIVLLWDAQTASPLDTGSVGSGQQVGSVTPFASEAAGQVLMFDVVGGQIVDRNTNSSWNSAGQAVDGALTGTVLQPLPNIQHFWFSYAIFSDDINEQ